MNIPNDILATLYDALFIARVFHEHEFENKRAVADIDLALAWLECAPIGQGKRPVICKQQSVATEEMIQS